MKTKYYKLSLLLAMAALVWSCGGQESTKKENPAASEGKDTLTTVKDTVSLEPEVVSITEKEALKKMRDFIKANRRKYLDSDYAEINDVSAVAGDYNADKLTDYFFNVSIDYGGDFLPTYHFLYDSKEQKIREITVVKNPDSFASVDPKALVENKVIGTALLWQALSAEDIASREVKAEFIIKGNKLTIDPKFKKVVLAAHNKVMKEISQMEEQMMQNQNTYEESETNQ
jgi:hypothetical protein